MARRVVKFQKMNVRLPKGATKLSDAAKNKILAMESDMGRRRKRLSTSDKCTIVFFKGRPVQRCEGRKLKAHNRKQCRIKKRGPNYGKFRKC